MKQVSELLFLLHTYTLQTIKNERECFWPGSSLLTLLDDIATLLDDISVMGKLAGEETAGVLGDDLSLNAQQVSGAGANRELPVVGGVAKGSLINKVILVPLALIISAFIPWAITLTVDDWRRVSLL